MRPSRRDGSRATPSGAGRLMSRCWPMDRSRSRTTQPGSSIESAIEPLLMVVAIACLVFFCAALLTQQVALVYTVPAVASGVLFVVFGPRSLSSTADPGIFALPILAGPLLITFAWEWRW